MKRRAVLVLALALLLCGCAQRQHTFPVDAQRIEALTCRLCQDIGIREVGTPAEKQACDLLEEELKQLGFSYEEGTLLRERFICLDGRESENLIAVCNSGDQGSIVTIVAHYDSVPASPGAADNAVSVAVLMEAARCLGVENTDFPGQIRLIFLGAEETGYHGSRSYVESLEEEEIKRHIACFNMDISAAVQGSDAVLVCNTLGGRTAEGYQEGNFLQPLENLTSRSVAQAWRELYGDGYGGTCHVGESDHVSFHNGQMDAGNVCWRTMKNGFPVLPETYHKPEDTPDTLDYDTAVKTGCCVLRGVQIALEQAGAQ